MSFFMPTHTPSVTTCAHPPPDVPALPPSAQTAGQTLLPRLSCPLYCRDNHHFPRRPDHCRSRCEAQKSAAQSGGPRATAAAGALAGRRAAAHGDPPAAAAHTPLPASADPTCDASGTTRAPTTTGAASAAAAPAAVVTPRRHSRGCAGIWGGDQGGGRGGGHGRHGRGKGPPPPRRPPSHFWGSHSGAHHCARGWPAPRGRRPRPPPPPRLWPFWPRRAGAGHAPWRICRRGWRALRCVRAGGGRSRGDSGDGGGGCGREGGQGWAGDHAVL